MVTSTKVNLVWKVLRGFWSHISDLFYGRNKKDTIVKWLISVSAVEDEKI